MYTDAVNGQKEMSEEDREMILNKQQEFNVENQKCVIFSIKIISW